MTAARTAGMRPIRAGIGRIATVGASALALLAGCGDGGTTAVEAASTPEPIVVDDPYRPDLARYLRTWCCPPGSEHSPGPGTVEAGVEQAGLVVLASIGDVRHGYVHRNRLCADVRPRVPGCGSAYASNLLELTGVRILGGALPAGVTEVLVARG